MLIQARLLGYIQKRPEGKGLRLDHNKLDRRDTYYSLPSNYFILQMGMVDHGPKVWQGMSKEEYQ